MIQKLPWLTCADNLSTELRQCEDEGRDVGSLRDCVERIEQMNWDNPDREMLAAELMDKLEAAPERMDYPYREPSDLESIRAERPKNTTEYSQGFTVIAADFDHIYGAWLGRCCGCLLGQPVEGWPRERITGLLKETENYPPTYYISSDIPATIREKYGVCDSGQVYGSSCINWINNVKHMPEDDDTNYTVIGLKALESLGMEMEPEQMAELWLSSLPISHTCTAERVAYRNFALLIPPPHSAQYRNPYREWIGAQIRADIFGYVTPGNPAFGAELAWRDASISHVKNGIYGEMLVAAMLSAAAVSQDIEYIIQAGLAQIPSQCRLTEAMGKLLDEYHCGIGWEEALNRIHRTYNESDSYDWCHTIPNAMIVGISLLYGGLSLEKTVGIALCGGFDTDCNAATAGSVVGMAVGATHLPVKWTAPLNDSLKSGVNGFGTVKLSDLANRTWKLACKNRLDAVTKLEITNSVT